MSDQVLKGDAEIIRRIHRMPALAVNALGPVVLSVAEQVGTLAAAEVPQASGSLAASAFVDGPSLSERTAAAHVGYTEFYAPFEHEGFHYGLKIEAPPKWLEHAADAAEGSLAPAVSQALMSALSQS